MAYTTRLSATVTVSSKDVRLTRALVEREHTITGLGERVVVYQNKTTGRCSLRARGQVTTFPTLAQAYAAALAL